MSTPFYRKMFGVGFHKTGTKSLGGEVSPRLRTKPSERSFLDTAAVIKLIDTAISSRRPFSFVRLGDGEGSLLGFSPDGANRDDRHYLQRHFEEKSNDFDILLFQDLLIEAIDSADLIGIRDDVWNASAAAKNIDADDPDFFDRFLRLFPLRDAERRFCPLMELVASLCCIAGWSPKRPTKSIVPNGHTPTCSCVGIGRD